MENREELVSFIISGQNRNAGIMLSELRKSSPCKNYAIDREKLLLIESAEELKRQIPGFYVDMKELILRLFEENLSTEEAVEFLCGRVKESLKEEKKYSYNKALDFINENILSNQLSVGGVAEFAGISQSGLVKIFSEKINMTPGDYIGGKRAEKSLEFLTKNMSVEKTAEKVGFSSVESYIRAFKKHMGMTPGMWKKKNL